MEQIVEEHLNWQQVLALLQVSSPTLYKIIKRGELVHSHIERHGKQRRRYFRKSDVEALKVKRSE